MSIARECIDNIMDQIRIAESNKNLLSEDLRKNDLAMQDLLHYIEREDMGSIMCLATIRKLKDLRIERRTIKNEYELLQSLTETKEFLQLKKIQDKIIRVEEEQKFRKYAPRVYKQVENELAKVSGL